jgi:hypothetical protein
MRKFGRGPGFEPGASRSRTLRPFVQKWRFGGFSIRKFDRSATKRPDLRRFPLDYYMNYYIARACKADARVGSGHFFVPDLRFPLVTHMTNGDRGFRQCRRGRRSLDRLGPEAQWQGGFASWGELLLFLSPPPHRSSRLPDAPRPFRAHRGACPTQLRRRTVEPIFHGRGRNE